MQLKEKKRNEVIEQKKRLEKHRKAIEDDISDVVTQAKTVDNIGTKKKVSKKRIVDKKAIKERQKTIDEKIMDNAREGKIDEKISLEEEPEETKIIITKEERAERFKRLHAMVQEMMNKQKD